MSFVIFYVIQKAIFPVLFGLCEHKLMDEIKILSLQLLISILIHLLLGLILRPAVLSIPYLLFLFYAPFLPSGKRKKMHGHSRGFFRCVSGVTAIIVLLQICLQITLFAKKLEDLTSMGVWGRFVQNIGIVELYKPE